MQPTFFVDVLGDNLGLMMEQGLQEAFADKPEIAIVRKAKESSGLVRDDYYDWLKTARDLLAGKDRIDFAVMLVGSNDSQALHDAAGTYELRSDKWQEIYAKRVDDIAKLFQDRKVPLVWVGLPIMRSEKLASDVAYINDIFRDEAAKTGGTFVDTWEAFVDDGGQYSDYGPDLSGQRVRLRTADGVHFTKAGARKLAMFVESDINKAFDTSKPPVDLASIVDGQEGAAGPQSAAGPQPAGDARPPIVSPPRPASAEPVRPVQALEASLSAFPQPGLSFAPRGLPVGPARWLTAVPQAGLSYGGFGRASLRPEPVRPVAAVASATSIGLAIPDLALAPIIPVKPAAGKILPLTTPPLSPGGALALLKAAAPSEAKEPEAAIERTLVEGKPAEARPGRADDFSWPRP